MKPRIYSLFAHSPFAHSPFARPPFAERAPLLLILLIFTLLTLYSTVTLPLGEAADETDHYQYLRFVARTGHPPLTEAGREEAGFKGGLAPLYYWLTAWPVALVGEDSLPDIRRVDLRPERHLPTDGLGLNRVLHTLDEQWPWAGQALAWHLVRLLSLPMGWVTIIATYALARCLLPSQKIAATGAAAFVAFLPRFIISSAVINDDNLVFALTALLLLVQVIILQGDRRPRTFAIFGALFGLALLTKYFSLILIPEILFTLVVFYRSVATRRAPLLAFLAGLALTAAPWFTFITVRFNRIDELGLIPGLAASLGEPQITEGLVGLLSGQAVRPPAATYALSEWAGLLYRSFWFEYGWMQIFASNWVYGLFAIVPLLALAGLAQPVLRRAFRSTRRARFSAPIPWLLALHLALFVVVVLARYILSATIDTGQGRHLYPALPVIGLLVALGLNNLRPAAAGRARPWLLLPAAGYLLLSVYTARPSTFIMPHYRTLPVTTATPAALPIDHRLSLPFGDGLSLAGITAAGPVSAGDALPVTLYWRAEKEAGQDYLMSLCLQDSDDRPVACRRGHFADGHYPARAWEPSDTLIDTVFIPIPACVRPDDTVRLKLELWPQALDSPAPAPESPPVLVHTFTEPRISIQPVDPLPAGAPPTVDLWRGSERLTGPVAIEPGESVTHITCAPGDRPAPVFETGRPGEVWQSVARFDTSLHQPGRSDPAPVARLSHFIAGPTLAPGLYRSSAAEAPPDAALALSPRARTFAPGESTLSFGDYLSPLSLKIADRPALDPARPDGAPAPYYAPGGPAVYAQLPVTIRWQARRWMADPLVVSLKLLDKDFIIGGERVATLGDRYPNVLWTPTEIVEETYPLQLKPDAPPGLYRLELSLVHQAETLPDGFEYLPLTGGQAGAGHNLYPATIRLLDPAHDSPPARPLSAQLGQSIRLTGFTLDSTAFNRQPSAVITLALYWQAEAEISAGYTVFTQLIGPDGQVWAQWDNPPQAGRYPTTAWTTGDTVVDRYTLTLRPGAPPGEYRLLAGIYDAATGQRLPVTIDGLPQPDRAIELAVLSPAP